MPSPWIEIFTETNGSGLTAGELVETIARAGFAPNGKILFLLEKEGERTVVRAFTPDQNSIANCNVGYNRPLPPLRIAVNLYHLLGFDPERVRQVAVKLDGREYVELAKLAGISRGSFSHYILGERHNPKTQERIARAFDIPRDELFPKAAA